MHRECKEILQAIGHPILILDPVLNIIWANEAATKMFGDSIIGEKCYEVYHKRRAPCEPYPCLTLKAFMDGKIHEHEMQVTDQHGKMRYFHCSANVALEDQDANPTAVLAIWDISERKRGEEALRQNEEKYRRLIETTDTSFVIVDSTGHVLDANLKYVAMTGYQTLDEILGRTVIEWTAEFDVERNIAAVKQCLEKGFIRNLEIQYLDKTGKITPVEINATVVQADTGLQIMSLCRDISERKRKEEELASHRDHLEELVRERTHALEATQEELLKRERLSVLGQITATVSHELRNPLGVIRSSIFYLRQRCNVAGEKALKHMERIEEQVGVCDSIVADLLEYTRGRHSEKVGGDLSVLLRRVLEENPPPPGVTVDRDFSAEPLLVPFDSLKLSRAMVNLLENAYQAVIARIKILKDRDNTYHASVKVSIMRGDGEAVIEVEDNGVGMDEETVKRAFEPLFTKRARGIGLGLAIVQKVIKEHGGRVFLTSRPNLGTKVTVVLPADYGGHIV